MKLPVISESGNVGPSVTRAREGLAQLDRLVGTIDRLHEVVAAWDDDNQKNTVTALIASIEELHKEAFVRVIREVRNHGGGDGLREAAGDDIVYAVLRRLGVLKPSLSERLEHALNQVRPMLATHGGDVELVRIDSKSEVTVRLLGACDGCPASGLTLREGVEKAIQDECPEIKIVAVARGSSLGLVGDGVGEGGVSFVSPFARTDEDGWKFAAVLTELTSRTVLPVRVDGRELFLWRSAGDEIAAYDNMCAHMGMPLAEGDVTDGILTCPHHGFRFRLATGECLTAPEAQLITHGVRVISGRVEVKFL